MTPANQVIRELAIGLRFIQSTPTAYKTHGDLITSITEMKMMASRLLKLHAPAIAAAQEAE